MIFWKVLLNKHCVLALLLSLVVTTVSAGDSQDLISFSQKTYGSMVVLDVNQTFGARAASKQFEEIFDFEEFASLCFQDVHSSLTAEEKSEVTKVFHEVFFRNFAKNLKGLSQKKINQPKYTLLESQGSYEIIQIEGPTEVGNSNILFFLKTTTQPKLVDLSVNGALLSRNYRGSFNKIYRMRGYQGLLERLKQTQSSLK